VLEVKDRALTQLQKELEEQRRKVEELKSAGAELQRKLEGSEMDVEINGGGRRTRNGINVVMVETSNDSTQFYHIGGLIY
jgi:predicted RNase H-like nuclease (RuvC/YqgF family)